jgi:hypothetical protein
MVAHPEALVSEASDVEGAPLREAQRLLTRVLGILNDPISEKHSSTALSLRLARAHALTLSDHLIRMLDSP